MADSILIDTVSSDQSQAFNFSFTFTPESWQKFWRCLIIGCVMADHLMHTKRSDLAKSWNELSTEVARLLVRGKVGPLETQTPNGR